MLKHIKEFVHYVIYLKVHVTKLEFLYGLINVSLKVRFATERAIVQLSYNIM